MADKPGSYPDSAKAGRLIRFHGGDKGGQWRAQESRTVTGLGLAPVTFLQIDESPPPERCHWTLSAFVSNLRYTTADEREALLERQEGLGRPESHCAVLIPIRKSSDWWSMAQDERRAIYERSNHTPIGLAYLPAIARQLHHCRDLGEPFDFLTWFEFAESETDRFRALLAELRSTEEWTYVERECEIWLTKNIP